MESTSESEDSLLLSPSHGQSEEGPEECSLDTRQTPIAQMSTVGVEEVNAALPKQPAAVPGCPVCANTATRRFSAGHSICSACSQLECPNCQSRKPKPVKITVKGTVTYTKNRRTFTFTYLATRNKKTPTGNIVFQKVPK